MRFGQAGGAGGGKDDVLHDMSAIGGDKCSVGGAVGGRFLFGRRRRRDRTELAGWGISLAVHLVAFALLWSLTWTIRQADRQERLIIPEARLARPDAPPIRTIEQVPKLRTDREQVKQPQYVRRPLEQELSWRREAPVDSQLKIIGIGTGGGFPLLGQGLNAGSSQAGPETDFFGVEGNAYRVCYIVDCSGSTMYIFEPVQRELKRSLGGLVPNQRFQIIFMGGKLGEPYQWDEMVYATAKAKEHAFGVVDGAKPAERGDLVLAFEQAFALTPKPDLIYVLTDSDVVSTSRHGRDILDRVRRLNLGKSTKINVIVFFSELDWGVLREMTREHGGRYKFIPLAEVDR